MDRDAGQQICPSPGQVCQFALGAGVERIQAEAASETATWAMETAVLTGESKIRLTAGDVDLDKLTHEECNFDGY